ncbi:MAG: efflux RND transporter periplasmic adaptor subunit [Proteobacteria bacterium]|nr:efflux RND transporter periplasmic adaptor subunit [Pseudomonadota bacterium]
MDVATAAAPARPPLYYQDPDGKPDYSPTPKQAVDGRHYVAVYEDAPASQAAPVSAPTAPAGKGKILYYRHPMGLPDTSPMPKKDSMGMDYLAVYENDAVDTGIVSVSPGRLQMLGVRTAPVEARSALARTVRATGSVRFDERRLAVVTTKVEGWLEKLEVSAAGDSVKRGQVLAWLYSPELVAAEQEYLVAIDMAGNGHAAHGDPGALADAAARRLRALDVPEDEVARLRRTRQVARRIAVRALADGIVIDKPAVEGMRVASGEPLYRTADLSTVWVIAEVQEADLGAIRVGERATASFVAYPGRRFEGTVDFVYPSLNRETRTGRVRVVVLNRDLALRADMYASVEVETPAAVGTGELLVVPDSAVIDGGTRQVVLVERGEGRFEPRPVRLGARGDGFAQVLDGVRAGERVVTGANFLIDAESNLRAALQSFAAPADAAAGAGR